MSLRNRIEFRLLELELLLKSGKYQEAVALILNITKFAPILTEEQRDFINAAKYAIENCLKWE
jgi:hypothetical protein